MAVNSIGDFEFLLLEGNPEPLKQQLEVLSRAGVDGVQVTRTGTRGAKFTVQSRTDAADRTAARALFASYCELIGKDPVPMTWWQIAMGGESFQVAVLDVRPVKIARVLTASGGLNNGSLGWCVCDWDLIAIGN